MEIKPIKTLERALSTEEVKRLATSCKRQAKSDEDLRRRLTRTTSTSTDGRLNITKNQEAEYKKVLEAKEREAERIRSQIVNGN